jgi:VanZ family protein
MSSLKTFCKRWLPALVVMAVIFAFSSIPASEMPNFSWADLFVKKGGHVLVYSLLALTVWYGFDWRRDRIWLAWLITFLYAVLDEMHQSFVPGRHPWWADVALDSLAAAIVLMAVAWWRKRKKESG